MVDVKYLKKIRPYVVIGCFVVGMILAIPQRAAVRAENVLRKLGETPFRIGSVVPLKRGRPRVEYR